MEGVEYLNGIHTTITRRVEPDGTREKVLR